MLANPQKFQALFLNCKEENFTFDLDNVTIIPDDVVKLLGVHSKYLEHLFYATFSSVV